MNLFETSEWLYLCMPIVGANFFWPGLILIGFAAGTIGGFFGMGGAWMVTPGLNILGFPMAFAIGTDMANVAGKSMTSTMRHSKLGNVDYKLAFLMLMGTMIGIELGAKLVMFLERVGSVGSVVRWVYVVFLALMATLVFYDCSNTTKAKKAGDLGKHGAKGIKWFATLQRIRIPPMMTFQTAGFTCSLWLPAGVSLLTGLLAGLLGCGGLLLSMPALVYLIGCPIHIAVGTDLFGAMISGFYGAFTYSMKGRIEIVTVFVMLTGAAVGGQIGTSATKYAKGYGIRLAFGTAVICCMISVVLKELEFGSIAATLILTTLALLCLYIIKILIQGVLMELREKKRMARYSFLTSR
jgi:hypothetical protein